LRPFLSLYPVYQAGGGKYAIIFSAKSPLLMGVLVLKGVEGGLTWWFWVVFLENSCMWLIAGGLWFVGLWALGLWFADGGMGRPLMPQPPHSDKERPLGTRECEGMHGAPGIAGLGKGA
jgi:hypothetical protein